MLGPLHDSMAHPAHLFTDTCAAGFRRAGRRAVHAFQKGAKNPNKPKPPRRACLLRREGWNHAHVARTQHACMRESCAKDMPRQCDTGRPSYDQQLIRLRLLRRPCNGTNPRIMNLFLFRAGWRSPGPMWLVSSFVLVPFDDLAMARVLLQIASLPTP